jgi:hypothetical protein
VTRSAIRVGLEVGKTWVFASAVDWPGWCRRGKGEDAALSTLMEYTDRYAAVAGTAFRGGTPQVVGRVPGDGTTDFGAPAAVGPWDFEPWSTLEATRQVGLFEGCWRGFDTAAAAAPAVLPKGPRGGGRDRDGIIEHVREAERSYARKIGARVPPRTPWTEQRRAISLALVDAAEGGSPTRWPPRYLVRRAAWHVLDHAWELEDKSVR